MVDPDGDRGGLQNGIIDRAVSSRQVKAKLARSLHEVNKIARKVEEAAIRSFV